MCLVGPAGCGKSSFAAQFPFPEAVIDPRDEGLIDLIYEQQISMKLEQVHKSKDYDAYHSNLAMAVQGKARTIICESVTGIQAMCYQASSKNDYDNDLSHKKFLNYQNGPITAAEKYFQKLLDLMLKAQNLGKHVILIGHTVPKQQANLEGDDYLAMLLGADKQMTLKIKEQVALPNDGCSLMRIQSIRQRTEWEFRVSSFSQLLLKELTLNSAPKPTETRRQPTEKQADEEIEKIKKVADIFSTVVSNLISQAVNGLYKTDVAPAYNLHMCRLNCALSVVTCDRLDGIEGTKLKEAATKYLLQEWNVDDVVNSLGDEVEEDL